MSTGKLESVVSLITSRDKSRDYGTGFIIHKNSDKCETYLMTCAHVINNLGGVNYVKVHQYDAEVVALGQPKGLDLAIIKVGKLLKGPLIRPYTIDGCDSMPLTIDGYHRDSLKEYSTRRISSSLGKHGFIPDLKAGNVLRWTLKVNEDSDLLLDSGCSGSPVLTSFSLAEEVKKVIGVVYKMENNKRTGFAISIKEGKRICRPAILHELEPFWSYLSQSSGRLVTPMLKKLISYASNRIEELRHENQTTSPELQLAFEWLSDKPKLAANAINEVLDNFPELIGGYIENFDQDDFQWEIEKYIECIYVALIDDCIDILQELTVLPSQTNYPQVYETAFNYLKQNIPCNLEDSICKKIAKYFDCINQSVQSHIRSK